jgi:hypothetical protein
MPPWGNSLLLSREEERKSEPNVPLIFWRHDAPQSLLLWLYQILSVYTHAQTQGLPAERLLSPTGNNKRTSVPAAERLTQHILWWYNPLVLKNNSLATERELTLISSSGWTWKYKRRCTLVVITCVTHLKCLVIAILLIALIVLRLIYVMGKKDSVSCELTQSRWLYVTSERHTKGNGYALTCIRAIYSYMKKNTSHQLIDM